MKNFKSITKSITCPHCHTINRVENDNKCCKNCGKSLREEAIVEVAPPGREKQVKELKKKFPGDKAAAFKIAWASYNKSHKEETLDEISQKKLLKYHFKATEDKSKNRNKGRELARNKILGYGVKIPSRHEETITELNPAGSYVTNTSNMPIKVPKNAKSDGAKSSEPIKFGGITPLIINPTMKQSQNDLEGDKKKMGPSDKHTVRNVTEALIERVRRLHKKKLDETTLPKYFSWLKNYKNIPLVQHQKIAAYHQKKAAYYEQYPALSEKQKDLPKHHRALATRHNKLVLSNNSIGTVTKFGNVSNEETINENPLVVLGAYLLTRKYLKNRKEDKKRAKQDYVSTSVNDREIERNIAKNRRYEETINEVSKEKLRSYSEKALGQVVDKKTSEAIKKRRSAGYSNALQKYAKAEETEVNEHVYTKWYRKYLKKLNQGKIKQKNGKTKPLGAALGYGNSSTETGYGGEETIHEKRENWLRVTPHSRDPYGMGRGKIPASISGNVGRKMATPFGSLSRISGRRTELRDTAAMFNVRKRSLGGVKDLKNWFFKKIGNKTRVGEETITEADVINQLSNIAIRAGFAGIRRLIGGGRRQQPQRGAGRRQQAAAPAKISANPAARVKTIKKQAPAAVAKPQVQQPGKALNQGPWGQHPASNLPPHIKQGSVATPGVSQVLAPKVSTPVAKPTSTIKTRSVKGPAKTAKPEVNTPVDNSGINAVNKMSGADFRALLKKNPKLKVRAGNEETDMNRQEEEFRLALIRRILDEATHKKGGGAKGKEGAAGQDTIGDTHPIYVMRKAISLGQSNLKHHSGETSTIHPHTAHRILKQYDTARTPDHKESIVRRIWKSKGSFADFLSGKAEETKKKGISLGGSALVGGVGRREL